MQYKRVNILNLLNSRRWAWQIVESFAKFDTLSNARRWSSAACRRLLFGKKATERLMHIEVPNALCLNWTSRVLIVLGERCVDF